MTRLKEVHRITEGFREVIPHIGKLVQRKPDQAERDDIEENIVKSGFHLLVFTVVSTGEVALAWLAAGSETGKKPKGEEEYQ